MTRSSTFTPHSRRFLSTRLDDFRKADFSCSIASVSILVISLRLREKDVYILHDDIIYHMVVACERTRPQIPYQSSFAYPKR